jgi:hypothetical protein
MEPENIHVKLNIDCKVENLPEKLFPMIKEEIFRFEHWETLLAPRIILGIWHVSRIRSSISLVKGVWN